MTTSDSLLRSEQRFAVTCAALVFGPLFMGGPAGLGIVIAVANGFDPLSLTLLVGLVSGSLFLTYHMGQSYHWVELDGGLIRGQRFWTREFVEREVSQVSEIVPLGAVVKTIHAVIADKLLGTVRGYEIRFRGERLTIGLVRSDMTHVDELVLALAARLRATEPLRADKIQ